MERNLPSSYFLFEYKFITFFICNFHYKLLLCIPLFIFCQHFRILKVLLEKDFPARGELRQVLRNPATRAASTNKSLSCLLEVYSEIFRQSPRKHVFLNPDTGALVARLLQTVSNVEVVKRKR